MKNPIFVLRLVLCLSLALSPSGGSISAQSQPAGGSTATRQGPQSKLAPFAKSSAVVAAPATARQPEAAVAGPNLTIDAGSGRHAISPYIYGINYNQVQIPDINPSVIRWGGDATSQYNWQTGNTNAGSDWYFINSNQNSSTDASDFDTFFATNHAAGVQTIGTIPINGWVAKDSSSCGFSVTKYGAQQHIFPYGGVQADCGNGILPDGKTPVTQVKSTDPNDTDVPVSPGFMQDWVAHTVSTFGSRANGGVAIWELDNEPVWWSGTHQNIHPLDTDFDEVWTKGRDYAQAVKAADPTAKVAGPITAGWWDLFFSKKDLTSGWGSGPNYVYWGNPVDRMAHGNQDFAAWYLQQFHAYETQTGQRLLDYFDIHGYMPGTGGDATDAASNAARFESTRVFWDETFTPPGTNDYILNTPLNPYNNPNAHCVCLIPRMKNWVNTNYPGTKMSITEYNLGAQGDINGALAETDLLGIFGREGLDVATLWPFLGYPDIPLKAPITYAFRMYRNYDDAKSTFGETGVSAVSTNQSQLSVYAAERTGDGALTVMVINKTNNDMTSSVSLANFTPQATAKVFTYSAANLTGIQPQPNQAVTPTGFSATFPANSATLLVIPKSAPASITANPNPIRVAQGVTVGQTTISWNAPGSSSVEVHVGSADGGVFAEGTSRGSAPTGDWVSNGLVFVLVDAITHGTLATTAVTLTTGETATIAANPNPIPVATGVTVGQTTLSWNAPGSSSVEVHLVSATGPLFSLGPSIGSAPTGDWVSNGMEFVLVDALSHVQLATTTVTLGTSGGAPTITANPNPIPGVTVGQTTISWNAPGSSSVEVHLGSAAGPLFSIGASVGSAPTGEWVTNGMAFVLVDRITHGTLATTTVALGTSGGTPTITASPNPAPGATVGETTITWNAPASSAVEVHVGSATGTLFAAGGSSGSAMTGDWVSNGLMFVLVDASTHTQLATTTVSLTGS